MINGIIQLLSVSELATITTVLLISFQLEQRLFSGEEIKIQKHDATIEDDMIIRTDKWNPMTYAVYKGNLELI